MSTPEHPVNGGRVVRALARAISRGIFRRIHRFGIDATALEGPTILLATHFGGFADPLVLLATYPRVPRFLAKSTLWNTPWLSPLLHILHALPVYRAQDGGTTENQRTFKAAVAALADGQTIAIFPEGSANDDPTVHALKTGAARLALEARAAGVENLHFVSVSARYEDKTRLWTDVTLRQGGSLLLDDLVVQAGVGSDEREAVRALTEALRMRLEEVAEPRGYPSALPRSTAAALVLAPVAMAGIVMNMVPIVGTVVGRWLRDAPVKEVTIDVFAAPVLFLLTWLAWLWAGWIRLGSPLWGTLLAAVAAGTAVLAGAWWRIVVRPDGPG